MTRIKVVVIGVAAHILALRRAGIDGADPIMIREEIDALAKPAGVGDIAIQLQQALECSTAPGVAPQVTDSSAAIALLICEVANIDVAPDNDAATRPERDGVRHAVGKLARLAPARRNRVEHLKTPGELPGIAGEQYLLAGRKPGIDAAQRTLVGQTPGHITGRRHDVHLAGTFLAPNEGQQRPIGRETRVADLANACCETFGTPAVARNKPEIIFRHKHDTILMNSWIADVTLRCHMCYFLDAVVG